MANFDPRTQTQLAADGDPNLLVAANVDRPLKAGKYEFTLEVTDSLGLKSDPVTVVVVVGDRPRAAIEVQDFRGTAPHDPVFATNEGFRLVARSRSANGEVRNFSWTLKGPQ